MESKDKTPKVKSEPKVGFNDNYLSDPLVEGKSSSLIKQSDLGIKDSDFEDYGSIHVGEDMNKIRAKNQSVAEQAGSFLTQSAGEIVGGAISGIGATLDIPDAIVSEFTNKDADFKNIITDAGDAISKWSKDIAPIHRENPGKTFDVTDSGWWFENGVSIASTLSLLIPAVGAVKGVSYVGKVLGLADELAAANKIGKAFKMTEGGINKLAGGIESAKYFGKIATSAIVSRNAENFKESAQVLTSTKESLMKEWDENPDAFNKLLESDVAKELSDKGRPVDKENLSSYIASKAAWLSYGVNSLNIGFDAIQLAPLFKGFKPHTTLSKLESSIAIKKAQALATGKPFTKLDYITTAMNPFSSALARNSTEGIEEAINYVGTKEGEAYADQLTGKKTKDLSGRIGDYLTDPHMYESAVWGVLGGIAFGGAANGLGRVANLVKGKDGYGLKEARVTEINNRVASIKTAADTIKKIEEDSTINDDIKKHHIAAVKSSIITELAIKSAQVGNYEMLRDHLNSDEMKKQMVESGYATKEDVDKAVVNSLLDAEVAIDKYKANYSLFQTKNIDDNIKTAQIAEKTYWDTVSSKHLEQRNQLSKDISTLKSQDNYMNTSSDINKDLTIQLEALKIARASIATLSTAAKTDRGAQPLSQYQTEILENADKKIADLESNLKERATLNTINPEIIQKQVELEGKNMTIEALGHKVNYLASSQYSKVIEEDNKKAAKLRKVTLENEFEESIKDKTKGELEVLKTTTKNKSQIDIINSKIDNLTKIEEQVKRKEDVAASVVTAQGKAANENTEGNVTGVSPIKQELPNHPVFDFFTDEFEKHKIDISKVNKEDKASMDGYVADDNYVGLAAYIYSSQYSLQSKKYAENLVTDKKAELLAEQQKAQDIVNLNTIPTSANADSLDETNLNKIDTGVAEGDDKDDDIIFAKKTSGEDNQNSLKTYVDGFNQFNFDGEEQLTKDEKGNLIVSKEHEAALTELYSLQAGDEITLKIDTTNSTYESNKGNKDELPIGIYSNNIRIGFLNKPSKFKGSPSELQSLKELRDKIGTNTNQVLKTTVTQKTNGTIVNTNEYHSITEMSIDEFNLYRVDQKSEGSTLTKLAPDKDTYTNEHKEYGRILEVDGKKEHLRGSIYLALNNVNGAKFPTPLGVSKLNEKSAKKAEELINNLLALLDSGLTLKHQEVIDVKDKLSELILVDDTRDVEREVKEAEEKRLEINKYKKQSTEEIKARYLQLQAEHQELLDKRKINLRVHDKSKDKPARIEMSFIGKDNTKHLLVYNATSLKVIDSKGKYIPNLDKSALVSILGRKYYNISFNRIANEPKYKEAIIRKGILRTNVGEVRTKGGKVLGNFTNFSINISTEVTGQVEEDGVKKTTTNPNFIEEQKNYSVYENKSSTSDKIIDEILADPKNEVIKLAAEALKTSKNPVKIEFKAIEDKNTVAVYNASNNTIYISSENRFKSEQDFQESILHEIAHAATVIPVINSITIEKDGTFTIKENANSDVVEFVQQMEQLRQKAIETINKKYPEVGKRKLEQTYGVTNVLEFISEVQTNKAFIEAIKEDKNLFERILDAIVRFLFTPSIIDSINHNSNNTELATREVVKFISNRQAKEYSLQGENKDYQEFKKMTDKVRVTPTFSSEEKNHLVNFTNNATLTYFKGTKEDSLTTENKVEDNNAKTFVKKKIQKALDESELNGNQKELLTRAIENFDELWKVSLNYTNRIFRIKEDDASSTEDDAIQDKKWDDNVANAIAMTEQLSSTVKLFIAMTPAIDTEGKVIKNIVTGLDETLPYGSVINLLIKHLSSAQSENDMLKKLRVLKVINPSFELLADNLEKDTNILAAFKSQFTRNLVDSNVLLISKIGNFIKAKVTNEFKNTVGYINISDNWNKIINNKIDKGDYKTAEFVNERAKLKKERTSFEAKFGVENSLSLGGKLTEEGDKMIEFLFKTATLIGIDLSIPAITDDVMVARTIEDVSIFNVIKEVVDQIEKGNKNNSTGNLNTIAKFQDKYDMEFAEIMALNLKGEPVYAAQLPSFLTNFFARLKSTDKTTREAFEREFKEIVENDPVMQKSNWAWSDENVLGLFNYEIVNGRKVPQSVNENYIKSWGIAQLGGSKNTITKSVEDYTEFTANTYKMTLAYMYLEGSNNKNKFCYIPSLIPADSGKLMMLKLSRFALKSNDLSIIKVKNSKGEDTKKIQSITLSEDSVTFKAIQNATFQEWERMKQAYAELFELASTTIKVKYYNEESNTLTEEGKKWFANLEKNYHYKEIVYKEGTNEVDVKSTIYDKEGNLTGRVFKFHNLKLTNIGKFKTTTKEKSITLNDLHEFSKPHELAGELSESFVSTVINPFIHEYTRQLIESEIIEHTDLYEEGLLKADAYSHIGNGTFEHFVAEMAINNYIHNVEQQVWFNGITAEFKNNIDTNKRAKQMMAPGNPPSTLGASEYRAITIQDVVLKSKTYDNIVEKVKQGLIKEKSYKYSQESINNFNLNKDKKEYSELEKDVSFITDDYKKINSGDAQGYITIKGLKEMMIKYGMMNDTYTKIFKQIESGKQLTVEAIKTLQSIKPFHYERKYNRVLNKMTSNQIKLSYLPLIPQLTKGTDLEKVADKMNKEDITRAFFESAHKIGATQIHKIADENGNIVDEWLEAVTPQYYQYANEQIQLAVPDHLVDSTNLLATQIAKLIVANLSSEKIYRLHEKLVTGDELKVHYFSILVKNIEESRDKLITDLKIIKEGNTYRFINNGAIKEVLAGEIDTRGLGKNYEDAIVLKEDGTFKLPLFTGKNAEKWESILTSIFTNRIMKQKTPGASLALASDLFLNKNISTQENSDIKGIEWQEGHDSILKSYREEDGKTQVVEVVMGSWSKQFFKDNSHKIKELKDKLENELIEDKKNEIIEKIKTLEKEHNNRISIDEIPDDVKTMVGYRIPTQAKHSMIVFKVVGFLPEESKGNIIMPNDIVTQMGSDFDIDKLFVMYKNFTINKEGNMSTDIQESSLGKIKALERYTDTLETYTKYKNFMVKSFNEDLQEFQEEVIEFDLSFEKAKQVLHDTKKKIERKDRENEIIEIYKTILTNSEHLKESFTPATFADFIEGKQILDELFETSDKDIDILSPKGQRTFRTRNMAGRVLKGISANFNAFLPVAQHSGMYLRKDLSYKQKVRVNGTAINKHEKIYDFRQIQKKYGEENVEMEGDYIIVTLTKLGKDNSGTYMNIDDNVITEVASQGIGAAVDIVKDPTFDAFNATTYTYPQFNLGLAVGANPKYMMFFTRQPILKKLNDDYFNNQSLLGEQGNTDRQEARAYYEGILFNKLIDKGTIKEAKLQHINGKFKPFDRKARSIFFGYDLDTIKVFSDGELYQMLINNTKYKDLKLEEQIQYLKDQLYILNQFNRQRTAGDAIQDVLKATKTDSTGAGPSLDKSESIKNLIYKSNKDAKVLVNVDGNTISATNAIYPKVFGTAIKSVYPVIGSYYENVNKISYQVLSPLFITQNHNFKAFRKTLVANGMKTNDFTVKAMKKFFNKTLLQDFVEFDESNKEQVLGTESYKKDAPKHDGTIETFKQLSTLEQTIIIKERTKNEVVKQQASILTRLVPNDQFNKLGYSKIEFNTNYKDTMLDDTFSEQLENLYYSGDEFKEEFVRSLMRYNYFANGMEFGFGSISKVFPPSVLISEGIGEHLNTKNTSTLFFGVNFNQFYKNNHNNKDIVPVVQTQWQWENGKIKTKTDEYNDEHQVTANGTPVWMDMNEIMQIPIGQLEKEPANVKNSPYLRLAKYEKKAKNSKEADETEEEDIDVALFKKYYETINITNEAAYTHVELSYPDGSKETFKKDKLEITQDNLIRIHLTPFDASKAQTTLTYDLDENGVYKSGEEQNEITVTPLPRYARYYKVNPLGKDGIIEMSGKSLWLSNRLVDEKGNLQRLEDELNKANAQGIANFKNITKQQIDNNKKEC